MEHPTSTNSRHFFALAAFAAGIAFSASSAHAAEACSPSTCPAGFECEAVQGGCALLACDDGDECNTNCEAVTEIICVRAACETDADCGQDMVCATTTWQTCDEVAPDCAEGANCEVQAESTCTDEERNECTPRWTMPCETASDCGAGFECIEAMMEGCSTGGSAGSAGSGSAASSGDNATSVDPLTRGDNSTSSAEDSASECFSEPTGEFYCRAIEVACAVDSDCPQGWTCIDNPMGACWQDTDGNSGCTTPDPAKLCQVPYAQYGGYGVDGDGEISADSGVNGSSIVALRDEEGEQVANEDDVPEGVSGSDATAAANVPGTSDPSPSKETAPAQPTSAGCSVQPTLGGQAGSVATLLVGMVMAMASRRRRNP